MQSVQESKQELQASIRYAENAISSAKATIESMEFRQEMAKKQQAEQTGREQTLQTQVTLLEERIKNLEYDLTAKTTQASAWKKELDKLLSEKEASSAPCGCQAYRDLEEKVATSKQTGREQALEAEVAELRDIIDRMSDDATGDSVTIKQLNDEVENLRIQVVDQAEFDRDVRDAITDFIEALKTTGMKIDE